MEPSSAEGPLTARLIVRPARPGDARAPAAIRVRGWQAAYRGQLPDDLLEELSIEGDAIRFADHLRHLPPGRRLWVAELDGEVVGFASTGPTRDDDAQGAGEVYAIYVRPDLIGRGIGQRLLDHAVRDLVAQGYSEAILWTLVTNAPARRFYERAGWLADGVSKLDRLDRFELNETRYRRKLPPD